MAFFAINAKMFEPYPERLELRWERSVAGLARSLCFSSWAGLGWGTSSRRPHGFLRCFFLPNHILASMWELAPGWEHSFSRALQCLVSDSTAQILTQPRTQGMQISASRPEEEEPSGVGLWDPRGIFLLHPWASIAPSPPCSSPGLKLHEPAVAALLQAEHDGS